MRKVWFFENEPEFRNAACKYSVSQLSLLSHATTCEHGTDADQGEHLSVGVAPTSAAWDEGSRVEGGGGLMAAGWGSRGEGGGAVRPGVPPLLALACFT